MKHLKEHWGIYFFAAVVVSVVAYWWFVLRGKCTFYSFENLDTANMSSTERDQYYKKWHENPTKEEEWAHYAVAQDMATGNIQSLIMNEDVYYVKDKKHLENLAKYYDLKKISYKIKCVTDATIISALNSQIKEIERLKVESERKMTPKEGKAKA